MTLKNGEESENPVAALFFVEIKCGNGDFFTGLHIELYLLKCLLSYKLIKKLHHFLNAFPLLQVYENVGEYTVAVTGSFFLWTIAVF